MDSAAHVVLLGLMGSGKTSIGRIVAARLLRPLVDGDELLEQQTHGLTAADIAQRQGIDALHELEREIALRALAAADPAVIGPASSVCDADDVLAALRGHHIVWLTAPVDYLARQAVKKRHRPLVHDGDAARVLAEQMARREPRVLALRPLIIAVDVTPDDEAAERIVAHVTAAA